MNALEIKKAAKHAGFELTDATTASRLVFTRALHTLTVNVDATWILRADGRGGRTIHGYTFDSLQAYLAVPRS